MKKILAALLTGCGGGTETENTGSDGRTETENTGSDSVMARFNGELEQGAVVKVLENDTAIELGSVDELIAAFNEAYQDKGISARMTTAGKLRETLLRTQDYMLRKEAAGEDVLRRPACSVVEITVG